MEVHYESILGDITNVIDTVRRSAARSVNCIMTAAYWLIGRRIVEFEQKGEARAGYGEKLLERLAQDLSTKYGRGFSYPNLNKFRQFYLAYPPEKILSSLSIESSESILSTVSIELGKQRSPTLSGESARRAQKRISNAVSGKAQTLTAESVIHSAVTLFPLPWSAYVRLLSVKKETAQAFYEAEALRNG